MTFQDLSLSPELLRAITQLGYESPTPIQSQAIPLLLEKDTDIMGMAQTGTGKTAAFSIPIIQKLDAQSKSVQALILCPTRELCLQIVKDIESYTQFLPKINTVAVYGGASISMQIKDLRRGAQIVVATPGRLIDIIQRREIDLQKVRWTVLDEADEMLKMGFQESINEILEHTPEDKNIWLFTATMPKEVKKITNKYLKDPEVITVSNNTGNVNIEHHYYVLKPRDKYLALKRIIDSYPDFFGIIFCRTKRDAQEVADKLMRDGYNSDALHGDLSQAQRDIVMQRYRDKSLQILVATDVAARGIDVSDVTHVVNYSLPEDIESYTHRSGRTARAGKQGISFSLITQGDAYKIRALENIVGKSFTKKEIPSGKEAFQNQLNSFLEKIKSEDVTSIQWNGVDKSMYEQFDAMSKEEIIQRFVFDKFKSLLEYYQTDHDLNDYNSSRDRNERGGRDRESRDFKSRRGDRNDRGDRRERGSDRERGDDRNRSRTTAENGYDRFFINVGTLDKMGRGDVLKLICDASHIKGNSIGRIDLKDKFAFFEVEKQYTPNVLSKMKNLEHRGRSLRVNLAEETSSSDSRRARVKDRV